uniref:Brain enriched myelin associated protein 1 n=1 Tax=Falco tinnunculus TaxID=100819 RepID=A0A8C4XLD8_FALTI
MATCLHKGELFVRILNGIKSCTVLDAKASVARDNVAVSSPKTMEQSPAPEAGGQSLGSTARRALPFAKSRSVFAFSWSVPGRTEDPATDSSVGSVKLDVSSEAPGVNKAPSESAEVPAAAAREEGTHKNLTQAPPAASLGDIDLAASVTPEGEDAAASKPKQVTFFDRIFKLEKGKERSKTQIDTQEERQTADLPDGRIAAEEAAGLQSASNTVPQGKDIDDCNQKDLRQDSAGVNCLTAEQPEKAEVKQDNLQAAAATDNSVMSFLKTLVSFCLSFSSLGCSTEQQPVTSVKSDKNVPSSQEPQTTKQNTKAPEPAAQQQAVASEAPKDVTKEKTSSTPMPLSKLFWKKSVKGDGGTTSSEETLNSTERPVAPAESEPVGQKSKESSKDKKSTVELSKQKGSKQETREQPDSREQQAAETDSIQNGGDASKEPSFKKTEKRQSLGGFFKGLKERQAIQTEMVTQI